MKFVQINGVLLTVEVPGGTTARPAQATNPWAIEGIKDLVAAMTGTAGSPVMVDPPSLTPSAALVGDQIEVFLGTFTGATPTGVLRLDGVNVTNQIVDGVYTATAAGALTLTVTAVPLPAVSISATVSAIPTQAPSIQTTPTITGSTTVGSILTRTAGTATGIPTPTRATAWLRNGGIIAGQTGNTLDTSGFAADDVIITRDDWTNSQGTASGTSAPWTLTVQPAITATPPALTAGQQATITFNTTPDTVTVTQGSATLPLSGTGTSRSFTPATTQPVSISATKAGYSPYSAVIENVQPATPVIVDDLPKGLLRVDNVSSATGIRFSDPDRYDAMSGVIDPTVTVGPQPLGDVVLRVQDGTEPAVGKRFVVDIGPWVSEYPDTFGFEVEWFAGAEARTGNGNIYDAVEGDEGKAIGATVIGYDASGSAEEVASNTLLIPAQLLKTTDTFTTEATSPISIDAHSGNNDADNRVYNAYGVTDIARVSHNDFLYGVGYGFVSTSEAVGSSYKVEANARTTDNSAVANGHRGLRLAAAVKSLTVGFQLFYSHADGLLQVLKGGSVVKSHAITLGYREAWKPALTVHEHNDGSGNPTATLRVYVNDTEILELSVTDPDLRGGKPGFRCEGGTSSHHYFFDLTVEKLA